MEALECLVPQHGRIGIDVENVAQQSRTAPCVGEQNDGGKTTTGPAYRLRQIRRKELHLDIHVVDISVITDSVLITCSIGLHLDTVYFNIVLVSLLDPTYRPDKYCSTERTY